MIDADIMARPTAASSVSRTAPLSLAPSRRYSLAVAATAALALPGINRQELTLALAEWRVLEPDATVRGVLDRSLVPAVSTALDYRVTTEPLDRSLYLPGVLNERPFLAEKVRHRLNDGDGA